MCQYPAWVSDSGGESEQIEWGGGVLPCPHIDGVSFENVNDLKKKKKNEREKRQGERFASNVVTFAQVSQVVTNIWRVSWYATRWVTLLRERNQFLELLLREWLPSPPSSPPILLSMVVSFLIHAQCVRQRLGLDVTEKCLTASLKSLTGHLYPDVSTVIYHKSCESNENICFTCFLQQTRF